MKKTTDQKKEITDAQRRFLEDLWFEWGKCGPKHSMANHKFIQHYLEHGEDCRKFYKPDKRLASVVDSILGDEIRRGPLQACEKCGRKTMNTINVMGRFATWCGCPN